jgi:hypothetical protein
MINKIKFEKNSKILHISISILAIKKVFFR